MAYAIDRYNNTLLTTVEDGTVDQTTDLKFIGKNYAGYGEIQNENFIYNHSIHIYVLFRSN